MRGIGTVVYNEILAPIVGRVGTFVAGSLVTYGVAVDHANAIGLGVAALVTVGVDLVVRRWAIKP